MPPNSPGPTGNTNALLDSFLRGESAEVKETGHFADKQGKSVRKILLRSTLVFFVSYLTLFVVMSLRPNLYDEGIMLTGAMRVGAGQIPHRDFYANYGPAQFYILAGLFKLFGTTLLVERLFDLLIKALIVAVIYAIASSYCDRTVAAGTAIVAALWVFGILNSYCGSAITPVSLLNLIGLVLILPMIRNSVSTGRMLAAGCVVGLATLFRYDTGIALLFIQGCLIAVVAGVRFERAFPRLRAFGSMFWPYIFGFAALTMPPALSYLAVAPLHPVLHDIVLYPRKYYPAGRSLPFPRIAIKSFDNITIYLIIPIAVFSICVGGAHLFRMRGDIQKTHEEKDWRWFLFAFGVLAFVMYFKGFVRISLIHMYLGVVPSTLILAVLVEHRSKFPSSVRISILCLAGLFASSAAWSSLREVKILHVQHASLPDRLVSRARRTVPETQIKWCTSANPLTTGICFLPEDDRIKAIEFIVAHTTPGQRIFSGLSRHDKIFANDDLIYFATQRLPATRWSHFDPWLQNRYDVQTEIVNELEQTTPPYVVRDAEFDLINEPNASSLSSGVKLLDEYLFTTYRPVETFGAISVWQRRNREY